MYKESSTPFEAAEVTSREQMPSPETVRGMFEEQDFEGIRTLIDTAVESDYDSNFFRMLAQQMREWLHRCSENDTDRLTIMSGTAFEIFARVESAFMVKGNARDLLYHVTTLEGDESLPTAHRFYDIEGFVLYGERLHEDYRDIFVENNIEQYKRLHDYLIDCLRFANTIPEKLVHFAQVSKNMIQEFSEESDNAYISIMSENLIDTFDYVLEHQDEIPTSARFYGHSVGSSPPLNGAQNNWSVRLFTQSYDIGDHADTIFEEAKKQFIKHNPTATEADLGIFLSKSYRKGLEEKLDINLNELPEALQYRAHYYALDFFKQQTVETLPEYKQFFSDGETKQDKLNRLTCTLALEGGESIAQDLLTINEKLPKDIAQRVFDTYAGIVNLSTQNKEEMLARFFKDAPEKLFDPAENIIKRAQKLIHDFAQSTDASPEKLTQKLEHISLETEEFLSTFKAWYEADPDNVDFEKAKALDFRKEKAQILSEKEPDYVEKMRIIHKDNYPIEPKGGATENDSRSYTREFHEAQLENFDIKMKLDNVDIYNLRFGTTKHAEPVSFMGFSDLGVDKLSGKPRKELTLVNVNPKLQNNKFADAMMKQALNTEAQGSIIEANCSPKSFVSEKYIESGFVAIRAFQYKGEDGLKIVRDDSIEIESKKISKEEIIDMVSNNTNKLNLVIMSYDVTEKPDFSLLDDDYILTRYFSDKKSQKKYCVFEKNK